MKIIIAILISLSVAGCVDDQSPVELHKSTYFFMQGPGDSLVKLGNLDPDTINIKVAHRLGMEIRFGNIVLLNTDQLAEVCGYDKEACYKDKVMYLSAGYGMWDGSAWVIAHELGHLYDKDDRVANQVASDIFPDHLRSNQNKVPGFIR